jgi:hypothetical protein
MCCRHLQGHFGSCVHCSSLQKEMHKNQSPWRWRQSVLWIVRKLMYYTGHEPKTGPTYKNLKTYVHTSWFVPRLSPIFVKMIKLNVVTRKKWNDNRWNRSGPRRTLLKWVLSRNIRTHNFNMSLHEENTCNQESCNVSSLLHGCCWRELASKNCLFKTF